MTRGGKRQGSGRPKGELTKIIRVPASLEIEIKRFIQDKQADKNIFNIILSDNELKALKTLGNDPNKAIINLLKNLIKSELSTSQELESFAKQVQIIVNQIAPDKGHGIRVYISDVDKHFDMSVNVFKAMLLQCHKDRYLDLSNANDGQQRSSKKGQLSEINNPNMAGVSYHFIQQTNESKITPKKDNGINYDKSKIIKIVTSVG
jgi:hypothetical protein